MKRLPLFIALLGLLLSALPGEAAPRKLLIAVMDKVNWHDLDEVETPTLDGLMRRAHIALLVTRTAGGPDGAGAYLTLGAGSRAAALYADGGPSPEGEGYNVSELVAGVPAGRAYEVQTGWSPGGAAIVHLGLGRLMQQNLDPSYPLRLGLLGRGLEGDYVRVACLGNADTPEHRDRDIVALAMDGEGRVSLGDVGRDLLRRDDSLPYGYTTDPARLAAAAARAARETNVLIVELGETSRAAAVADLLPPMRADTLRLEALARADRLLGTVLRQLGDGWAVLVITPSAPPARRDQSFAPLTPIISTLFPGGPGLLTSPSTRRPGLVTNTDVAATVLSFFGQRVPPDSVGRPMAAVATKDPRAALFGALARHDALEAARRQVFRAYATFAAAVLWLGALMLFVGRLAPAWTRAVMRGLLLSTLAVPLAALIVGLAPAALSSTFVVAAVICLSPLLALLASLATRWRRGDAALAGAVTVLLVADLLTGQHLLQWSTLSYSASAAARFYGIGNEYAGIILGAALVAATALAVRGPGSAGRRAALTVGLLVVAALVGWPRFGANFGMTLAAAVGLGAFCLYLWRDRPSWRDVVLVAVAVITMGGFVVATDVFRRGGASHVGLLVRTINAEGWGALTDVIVRKLTMNWLLTRVSQWTDVAIAALGVFGIAAIARPAGVLQATTRWRWLVPACAACFAGAAAAFLLNDSGIVAAALALCYGAASLAYLGAGEIATEPKAVIAPPLQEAGRR